MEHEITSEIYDTIIVGAGPGGATAAFFLSEAGQRVMVLEKEALPRYKACGGGISTAVLEQFPFSFEPVVESRVKAISYILKNQTVTIPLSDRAMRMVMRDHFDVHILKHAKAEIREGKAVQKVEEREDRVVVETADGSRFEGRYLVAADGANSVVARCLGLRRNKVLAAAIEAEVPVPAKVLARFADRPMFIFGEVRTGYLWIFPKSGHLSIGIGALHPKPGELQATLKRVIGRYGISLDGVPLHGHPLPIHTKREPIAAARTLLVGDAAGLVDPFTGEGIRFAIKSGRLAAESILSGHTGDYAALIDYQIGRNHRLGIILTYLFYNLPELCFELGARNPFVTHALMDMLADRVGYKRVLLQMFGTLPLFLFIETIAGLGELIGGPKFIASLRKAIYSI